MDFHVDHFVQVEMAADGLTHPRHDGRMEKKTAKLLNPFQVVPDGKLPRDAKRASQKQKMKNENEKRPRPCARGGAITITRFDNEVRFSEI